MGDGLAGSPFSRRPSHPRADHRYFYASEVAALVTRQQVESVEARHETAFWLPMCGQKSLFKRELQAIGPRLLARPWKYLGDPATVYAEARKLAGL